jgi:hypothetical protein
VVGVGLTDLALGRLGGEVSNAGVGQRGAGAEEAGDETCEHRRPVGLQGGLGGRGWESWQRGWVKRG